MEIEPHICLLGGIAIGFLFRYMVPGTCAKCEFAKSLMKMHTEITTKGIRIPPQGGSWTAPVQNVRVADE